jgi:hypothetical protein
MMMKGEATISKADIVYCIANRWIMKAPVISAGTRETVKCLTT